MNNFLGQFDRSSPEGVVAAPKGARFFRDGERFFLSVKNAVTELSFSKKAFLYSFYKEAWFPALKSDQISFSRPYESWVKIGNGNNKAGWRFLGYSKTFTTVPVQFILEGIENAWAGSYFTHFLKTNGDLYSAGENYVGQLGVGDTFERSTGSISLSNVKFVAKGMYNYSSAAVTNDGQLWFTGYNGNYQFGNGTSDDLDEWTTASFQGAITGSGEVKAVSFGSNYTALLMADDTLWVAGCEFDWCDSYPVQVDTNVKEISAGGYHLLYVKNDGTLYGIGENSDGQLGNDISSYYDYYEPVEIDTNVKFVAAGGYHSLYIKNDDSLWGMGGNWDGQIGNGDSGGDSVFVPTQIDTNVKTVDCGDDFTLYVKNNNTLWGMGYNGNGELGLGDWNDVYTPVQLDTDVEKVTAGDEHTVYIKTDKTAYGMGYNYYFQLGGAIYDFALFSTSASTGWTSDGVTKFSFSDNYSVDYGTRWKHSVYADGKFVAVGGEGYTKAMYSTDGKIWNSGSIYDVSTGLNAVTYGSGSFVAVSNVSDAYNDGRPEIFTSVDGINWETGSLTNTNYQELNGITYGGGQFVAVGDNRIVTSPDAINWTEQTASLDNVLVMNKVAYGNGTYAVATGWGMFSENSTFSGFTPTFDGNEVSHLSAGGSHACVVKDGVLYGAGYSGDGQLNANVEEFIYFYPLVSGVKSVTCFGNSTLFIKNDDTLWGMGNNGEGQLGDGTFISRYSPVQIDTNVSASFAGPQSGMAVYVKNDGTLWGMGRNYEANPLGVTSSYVNTPVLLDNNVAQASTGEYHIIYIKNDGTVWTVGENAYGQLGDGTNTSTSSSIQVDVSGSRCAAVRRSSYYVKTDGSLYAMGYNGDGQLGDGTNANKNVPTLITSSGVVDVTAGYYHVHYLLANGDVYGSGYNGNGQLGTGDFNATNIPVLTTANDVKSIRAGGSVFSYVVKNDGTVFFTGYDTDGQSGTNKQANKGQYSTDGVNWSSSYMPEYYYNDIAFGNGRFVTIADYNNFALSSTDGINWTSSYITTNSYFESVRIIFDGTKFVTCADYGQNGYNIATSTDGISWSLHKTGQNNEWGTIAYGDGKYILLAYDWENYVNPTSKLTIE